jgi:hypothetical protein
MLAAQTHGAASAFRGGGAGEPQHGKHTNMSDRETALSIVIRAVDHATGGIKAINKRLDAITKPYKDSAKAASELREHLGSLGFDAVSSGIHGVGTAVSDTIGRVAVVGAAVAAAAYGVKSLVDEFASLGHTAQRAGVEVDFLAGLRYSAEQTGVPLEALDEGITTLTQNLGQMKAGTGRAFKFLEEHASPALARQMIAAHGTAEALGLLADAMAKLPDAERRAALAQKLVGNNALAPLLARGSKGIQQLMTEYAGLAGSQGDAAESSLETEHSLHRLRAASDGVKAALVTGLSPALTEITGKTTKWLVDHREDIRAWAKDIGDKLPGAVDKVVAAVKRAVDEVKEFVGDIGGWKVAALGVAAVMSANLVSAIGSVSAALLATPVGQVVAGLAAMTAGVVALIGAYEDLARVSDTSHERLSEDVALHAAGKMTDAQFDRLHPGFRGDASKLEGFSLTSGQTIDDFMANGPKPTPTSLIGTSALDRLLASAPASPPPSPQEINIKLDISGAPRGMRATAEAKGATVDLTTGHQLLGVN